MTAVVPRWVRAALGFVAAVGGAAALGCAEPPSGLGDGGEAGDGPRPGAYDAGAARPDRAPPETTLVSPVPCGGGPVTSPDGRLVLWFQGRPCVEPRVVRVASIASAERPAAWRVELTSGAPEQVIADVRAASDELGFGAELEVDDGDGTWRPAELVTTSSGATLRTTVELPASVAFRFAPCRERLGAPPACAEGLACVVEPRTLAGACGVPCVVDAECPSPLSCLGGRCLAVECDGPADCLRPGTRCLSVERVGLCVGDEARPMTQARAARVGTPRGTRWPAAGAGCSPGQRACPVDLWDPARDFDPEASTRPDAIWWYGVRYENVLERFVPMGFKASAERNAGAWAWAVRGDLGSRLGTAKSQTVTFGGLTYRVEGISMKRQGDVPTEPIEAPVLRFRAPAAGLYDLRIAPLGTDDRPWVPEVTIRDVVDRARDTVALRPTGPAPTDPWVLDALRVEWDEAIEVSAPQRRAESLATRSFELQLTRHR